MKKNKEDIQMMRDSVIIMAHSITILAVWIGIIGIATIFWYPAIYILILGAIILLFYTFRVTNGIKRKMREEWEETRK